MNKFFFLFLLVGMHKIWAQQDPRFTIFNHNYVLLNPATVGSKDKLSLVLLHRSQWVNYGEGAPLTTSFSADIPVYKLRAGMGITLINDKHGIYRSTTFCYNYAILAHTSEYGRLSLGTNIGFSQSTIDYESIQTDPHNLNIIKDPNLNFGQNLSTIKPILGLGVYYHDRIFKVGISMPTINAFNYYGLDGNNGNKTKHYFITTGLNLSINNHVKYNPRVLVKIAPNTPVQAELSNLFVWKKIGIGATVRTAESVSLLAAYTFGEHLNVCYSYDIVMLNKLSSTQFGSHEIGLNYIFKIPSTDLQQKVFHLRNKLKCVDFDRPGNKKFFKHVEDLFYDRN